MFNHKKTMFPNPNVETEKRGLIEMTMKINVTHYDKCLCCGNVEGYIMRNSNTNSGLTDRDIYAMIASNMEPENRVRSNWCEFCNMETKQETVGWDYRPHTKATPPIKGD